MKELNELVELAKEYDSATTVEEALAVNNQFKATATRHTILAIAEALQAVERRAEAAEADNRNYSELLSYHIDRQTKAEAKLAELEKQQAVGTARMELTIGKEGLRYYQCFVDMRPDLVVAELNTGMDLFTRAAPAVSLAGLVPDEMTLESYTGAVTESGHFQAVKWWNNCRAATLRNIEETK